MAHRSPTPKKRPLLAAKSAVRSSAIAILSDIHSNLHALDAVLAECARRGIRRFFCLGDIVGYAAYPAECLGRIRALRCPAVLGNHDFYVARGDVSDYLNEYAQAGVAFSIQALTPRDRAWLARRPPVRVARMLTLVHASLEQPLEWDYVVSGDQAVGTLTAQTTPVCFYGHTHRPALFAIGPAPERISDDVIQLHREGRCLINPGSVGQPRGDGDPRAQFAIFDPRQFRVEMVRLAYDVDGAARAILAAGLPDFLAERLFAGV